MLNLEGDGRDCSGVQTDPGALKMESQQGPGRLKGSDSRQWLSV